MKIPGAAERAKELSNIEKEYPEEYWVVVIFIIIFIGYAIFADKGYIANVFTEVLSVVFTIQVLDSRARRRENQREDQRLKENLIAQLGSTINDVAVPATEALRRHGWLTDGSLQGAYLELANLQGANLEDATLQGANLFKANLQEVILYRTNLQEANLWDATLQGAVLYLANLQEADLMDAKLQKANLTNAKLQGANLTDAKLQKANLTNAKLQGADLTDANLQEADLTDAKFDENTILPDGYKWSPETDMGCFTDPDHSDFWSPPVRLS